ncbi:hypothetical protein HOU02_gp469 [Caulobacter phage CcrBL9]|uniref:Uncharacterized protein n=1 Tax=Caulobacter phage CcrBL9 TaxID=2283270 RepID=A0A385EC44_9CAUD|nr:hypothetical protein HOU02_gp469 [Caulobacter phage CcrBL9]AXQ69256.1 hypothetical protein CcrBL9_gp232c [Caulobacter phage CcrBL9]
MKAPTMRPSLNTREHRYVSERDAELARFDAACPEERICLMDFTVGDLDLALGVLGFTREDADWAMVWGFCERQYRRMDNTKIEIGAKAYEDLIQRSLRPAPKVVEPNRLSARERLRQLSLGRSVSRSASLRESKAA